MIEVVKKDWMTVGVLVRSHEQQTDQNMGSSVRQTLPCTTTSHATAVNDV